MQVAIGALEQRHEQALNRIEALEATVAALTLTRDWGLSYGELLAYATPGFLAFGLFSLPAAPPARLGSAFGSGLSVGSVIWLILRQPRPSSA